LPPKIRTWILKAQERTNSELESEGLYVTHLFRESEVILIPEGFNQRVSIPQHFNRLSLFRPATLDRILTKMARGDANDLVDIDFLLRHDPLKPERLRDAFKRARVPEIPEIQDLFRSAQSKVLALAAANQGGR
jgi:hypothetical protein